MRNRDKDPRGIPLPAVSIIGFLVKTADSVRHNVVRIDFSHLRESLRWQLIANSTKCINVPLPFRNERNIKAELSNKIY